MEVWRKRRVENGMRIRKVAFVGGRKLDKLIFGSHLVD